MNRLLLFVVVLVAAVAAGCGTPCGPANCAGCCDPHGACQATAADACGLGGTVCSVCSPVQSCVEGSCQFESGAPTTGTSGVTTSTTSTSSGTATHGNTSSGTTTSTQANGTGTSGPTAQSTAGGPSSGSTGSPASSSASTSSGPATTSSGPATTATSTSTGNSSSGTTGSGLLGLCSPCTQLGECASGFCNTSVLPGYCDTENPCSPQGGAGRDCSPYSCGSGGDCVCPQAGTTGSTGSMGCSMGCTTDAECQNSCPAVTNASNCCDASGVCYVSNTLTCPVPSDGGGNTTGY